MRRQQVCSRPLPKGAATAVLSVALVFGLAGEALCQAETETKERLAQLAVGNPDSIRQNAAIHLALLVERADLRGQAEVVQLLGNYAEDPDAELVKNIAFTLGKAAEAIWEDEGRSLLGEIVNILLELSQHDSASIRAEAISSLGGAIAIGRFGESIAEEKRVEKRVLESLRDGAPEVRANAVRASGYLASSARDTSRRRILELATPLILDSNPDVVEAIGDLLKIHMVSSRNELLDIFDKINVASLSEIGSQILIRELKSLSLLQEGRIFRLLATTLIHSGSPNEADGALRDAVLAFLAEGEYSSAVECAGVLVKLDPANPDIINAHTRIKGFLARVTELEAEVASSPQNLEAKKILAGIHLGVGYHTGGIDIFLEVIAVEPDNAETWNNLGLAYYKAQEYDKAIQHLEKSVSLDPNDPMPLRTLGVVYAESEMFEKALGYLTKALALAPDDAETQKILDQVNRLAIQDPVR